MKHFLILTFLLLLSSLLFGQSKKTGLLYIWENGSRYIGEWKDGYPFGIGELKGENFSFIGEFKKEDEICLGILSCLV